ncbi:MAG: MarR family transcriptional regulator [Acidobacteriota bacterium]
MPRASPEARAPVRTLQEEIQQTRPFSSVAQEAAVSLLRTTDVMRRHLMRVVDPRGITLQQYNVLRILRGAGATPMPTLAIAERMVERTPGITRLLDRLANKGYVERVRCAHDRRQVLCTITEAGLALLDTLDEPMNVAGEHVVDELSETERAQLVRLLDRVRACIHAHESSDRA